MISHLDNPSSQELSNIPPSHEGDASPNIVVSVHINKVPYTSSLSNLIEIIWSGFFHYKLKEMLDEMWRKKSEAGEPEIKTGKSPGAKEKRDLNGRSTNP